MNVKSYLKKYVNLDYFEFPYKKIKAKFLSLKFHLNAIKATCRMPEIFICNKTSPYDKYFVSHALDGYYVFLKDEVVEKIYNNSYSENELKRLYESIETLRDFFISIVIFPERHQTIFGNFSKTPQVMTDFIYSLKYNKINFINLIGTFFIRPIWANKDRICDTKLEKKFSIDNLKEIQIPNDEFNEYFNKYTPSSASTYSRKFPVYVKSNELAKNAETILYLCPNCKTYLNLYSEFSCIKCKECGSAFEFSENYEIALTNQFKNLDEAKSFQYAYLESIEKTEDKFITYNNIGFGAYDKNKFKIFTPSTLDIYQSKFIYKLGNDEFIINYEDIEDIFINYNNILHVKAKNSDQLYFQGLKNENFYILLDLIKIYTENKTSTN